jgi:hypothetical protein
MLVGNEYGFYFIHSQTQALHTVFCLAAADSGIHQYGFLFVADIVAVAVASGIERGEK